MKMEISYKEIRNRFDFFIRKNLIQFSRKNYSEKGFSEFESFSHINPNQIPSCLKKYKNKLSEKTFIANLIYYRLLEASSLKEVLPQMDHPIRVLDVGSEDFSYCIAIYEFFNEHCEETFTLQGIELDGFRLYRSLFNSLEKAKYYTKLIPNCSYKVGNVFDMNEKFHLIFNFSPFILRETAKNWGLPSHFFQPKNFFRKQVYGLLESKGFLFSSHPIQEEFSLARNVLKELGMKMVHANKLVNHLSLKSRKFYLGLYSKIRN